MNDNDGISYLPVTSIFELVNSGLRPVGEFTYTLEVANVTTAITDADNKTINSGLQFKNGEDGALTNKSSATVKFDSMSSESPEYTETQTAKIDLSTLNSTSATTGVYRYTLSQTTKLQNDGGTYADNIKYTVDLYISGGKVTYIKVWNADKKSYPSFTNSINNSDTLYVTNFIDYDMADKDETFEFQVTIPCEGVGKGGIVLDEGTPIYGTITNEYGAHESRDVTFYVVNKAGDSYLEVVEKEDGTEEKVTHDNKVKLYSGDKLVIPGLPVNMKYIVEMVDANGRNYTSTRAEYKNFTQTVNTPDVWGDPTSYPTIVNDSTTEVTTAGEGTVVGKTYTNNLGKIHHVEYVSTKGVAATGVTMDTTPYIVMFVAAAGLAVLSLAKKKIVR
jgi:hypothetical protein